MRTVVYPGTFDPIHRGHIDIAERASKLFDQIIFAVAINSEKNPLFASEERIELILESTKHIPNVKAFSTDGLIADFAREHKAIALIRGLRHVSDFEFEFQMATMNHHLNDDVSTLLMVTSEHYIHLNSSVVKDVARLNGDVSKFVTPHVMDKMKEKFQKP
jgi:pantetheine-phosphate adenylyltransferase|tara:strand:+ start:8661 stop:9143 length:483 start_codon:yes stop_codon:yes gene_type:complete